MNEFVGCAAGALRKAPSRQLPTAEQLYKEVFLSPRSPLIQSQKGKKFRRTKKAPLGFFYQSLWVRAQHPNPQESLQDLLCKSKFGIAPGEVGRESKVALALGDLLGSRNNGKKAANFYRKLFFAAEAGHDEEGKALAANRLGVLYYNTGRFKQALKLHEYHNRLGIDNFTAQYNIALTHRMLGHHLSSLKTFKRAGELAERERDQEGTAIATAQLALSTKIQNDLKGAERGFRRALGLLGPLKGHNIWVEVKMALGFVCSFQQQLNCAEREFHDVMKATRGAKSDISRINVGILRAFQSPSSYFINW